jgi:hypothetical protein
MSVVVVVVVDLLIACHIIALSTAILMRGVVWPNAIRILFIGIVCCVTERERESTYEGDSLTYVD